MNLLLQTFKKKISVAIILSCLFFLPSVAKGYTININPATIEPNKIPDFRGMGLRDALQLAKKIPVKITFEGYGKVVSQSFNKGTTVSPNNSIHLKLSPSK